MGKSSTVPLTGCLHRYGSALVEHRMQQPKTKMNRQSKPKRNYQDHYDKSEGRYHNDGWFGGIFWKVAVGLLLLVFTIILLSHQMGWVSYFKNVIVEKSE
jgi:hypothetical protein